jgi:hypothetical protein
MAGRNRLAALLLALLSLAVGALLTAGASAAKPRPYHHKAHARCTPLKPPVGGQITFNGEDFLPNDHVVITLHSKVTTLGTADADAEGNFSVVLQLPAGVSGPHTVTATGTEGPPKDEASCQINIGAHGAGGQNAGGNHQVNNEGTSFTGVEVAGIGVVGVALLVGGALLVISARKRRTAGTD